ncbi:hypothetical protein A2Y85_02895 [candidate division WOR-3 bacterium RBG_13_43_14]|uniref:AAA+ ATPase domain-containing protein n=1 Tax=candidate division WOR-3 bacterium RBG_13_43_14 TaxID=1802590 RepID=A0A1F4UAY8_UNCW3|nr:MAG: hypothetical protein A2Y85_02895 [candidate division WOR-3 bacterium RBG_13_43_14]
MKNLAHDIDDLTRLNIWRQYQSTLSLILYAALIKFSPQQRLRIENSMSHGFYCLTGSPLSKKDLIQLLRAMQQIIDADLPIKQPTYNKNDAIKLFKRNRQLDKVNLLKNCRVKNIKVSSLGQINDFFLMPPFDSTGKAPNFYLKRFTPGFIMVFPTWQNLGLMPPFKPQPRLAKIFNEYEEWSAILQVSDLSQLNQAIRSGMGPQIIKISEALHEKKIVYIADRITREQKKLILIAGPSSAGKTTFTKRLAIQMMVNGIRPHVISADDYFLPHSKTPRGPHGKMDFETINAVDIALLNNQLRRMLDGRTVETPIFNFITGRRNKGRKVRLEKNDIILLEGIHCLNEKLTYSIDRNKKLKIYISALTQLNIDDHNRVSTTDTRMLRRIIRDTLYRGYDIIGVLNQWGQVRRGEEKNIYPFQEESDEMFNSALVYEPAIMKKYVVPILRRVKKPPSVMEETNRLIRLLDFFPDLEERDIPSNSILREFIGGSSFVY